MKFKEKQVMVTGLARFDSLEDKARLGKQEKFFLCLHGENGLLVREKNF